MLAVVANLSGAVRTAREDSGMEPGGTARMETFSDGVFAIAATLLVLEIGIGTGAERDLGQALIDLWPSYLAYATSFLVIGIIWVNHHDCVACMDHVDRPMLFINTVFLMVVAFIPFPTKLVADHLQKPGQHAAVYAYVITLVLMSVTYNLWWRYARRNRRLIRADTPQSRVDAISRAFDPGTALYLIVLVVAVFSPLVAIVLTLLLAVFYIPAGWLFERRMAR